MQPCRSTVCRPRLQHDLYIVVLGGFQSFLDGTWHMEDRSEVLVHPKLRQIQPLLHEFDSRLMDRIKLHDIELMLCLVLFGAAGRLMRPRFLRQGEGSEQR